jgi:hypothetical protein
MLMTSAYSEGGGHLLIPQFLSHIFSINQQICHLILVQTGNPSSSTVARELTKCFPTGYIKGSKVDKDCNCSNYPIRYNVHLKNPSQLASDGVLPSWQLL